MTTETLTAAEEEALYAVLDRAAARAAPEVRRAFLASVRAMSQGADADRMRRLEVALAVGDTESARDLIPWEVMTAILVALWIDAAKNERLLAAVLAGQRVGAGLLPSTAPPLDPERLRELAVQHLRSVGPVRARKIVTASRQGMQRLLVDTYKPQPVAATDIRTILVPATLLALAGLNQKQAKALAKRIRIWAQDPKLTAARVQKLALAERARALKQRARLIGSAEAYALTNDGVTQAWQAEKINGLPYRAGRFIDHVEGVTVERPPLHPRCYCSLRLKRLKDPATGLEYYASQWVARMEPNTCPRCWALHGEIAQ